MNIRKIIKEELDDLDWIRDVNPQLPMDRDWWLINDVDPHSLEVSREIQDFLFNQGFMWLTGRKNFLPNEFSAISHRGGTYERQEGLFGYYPTSEHTAKEIEEYEAENGEIYYWSKLSKKPKINESDDLSWIRDITSNTLDKNENWILVNDIDRESISEGREIQKYLFDLGYDWGSGDFQSLKDFCIYTIYHYGNIKDGNQIYYQDGCRSAEVRISDKDIKGGRHMIYYWSDLKPV